MLKIVDKNNRVKFILEDDADEPRAIVDEDEKKDKEVKEEENKEENKEGNKE